MAAPLPLDDPRWQTLRHAYGAASDVPEMLAALARGDDRRKPKQQRDDVWHQLWSALCHQGTVYTASYAAIPHVVAIAVERPAREQPMFWSFVGAIAGSTDADPVPRDVRAGYAAALADARTRVPACLVTGIREGDGRAALTAYAELHGELVIAAALEGLGDGELRPTCPGCEMDLFVTVGTLPFVVSDEDPADGGDANTRPVEPREPRPAIATLAALARGAGLASLAARIAALDGTATCPVCEHAFALLDLGAPAAQ